MKKSLNDIAVDRRSLLLAGCAAVGLAACSSDGDASTGTAAPSETVGAGSVPTANPSTSTVPVASSAPDSVVSTDSAAEEEELPEDGADGIAALTAADFDPLATCMLLREMTAGPFGLDEQFDRRDITEGYSGHPLRLGLRVVDAACSPVPGATVEIWHTDATGDYSAFDDNGGGKDEGAGTTFMRGSQTAGEDGIVEFQTIYPGWYPGRAVHIHLRVFVAGDEVLTSQLFFDDDYTAAIYATGEYAPFGLPNTTNQSDRIAGDPDAEGSLIAVTAAPTSLGMGTLGLANLGIDAPRS